MECGLLCERGTQLKRMLFSTYRKTCLHVVAAKTNRKTNHPIRWNLVVHYFVQISKCRPKHGNIYSGICTEPPCMAVSNISGRIVICARPVFDVISKLPLQRQYQRLVHSKQYLNVCENERRTQHELDIDMIPFDMFIWHVIVMYSTARSIVMFPQVSAYCIRLTFRLFVHCVTRHIKLSIEM